MEYNIHKLTSVKPENEVGRENEDFVIVSGEHNLLGLSDGAGGYGAFAKDWAEKLLTELPASPINSVEELDSWIGGWWEAFYDEHAQKASKDSFLLEKFQKEGSAATLVAVWLQSVTNEKITLDWLCYGDSFLFLYRPSTNELWWPKHLQNPQQLSALPYLLNWSVEQTSPLGGDFGKGKEVMDGDIILLSSDALGQFLLLAYMAFTKADNKSSSAFWEELLHSQGKLSSMANEIEAWVIQKQADGFLFIDVVKEILSIKEDEAFEKWCTQMYDAGLLSRDDYSLITCEFCA